MSKKCAMHMSNSDLKALALIAKSPRYMPGDSADNLITAGLAERWGFKVRITEAGRKELRARGH